MDARKLETTRNTAIEHVQRCTPTCPSSTSCQYRHARRKLREGGKPSTREVRGYTRFVLEVERIYGCSVYACAAGTAAAFDLLQSANDAALFELLIDGCTKRLADCRAFVEEANKAMRPGPQNRKPRQGVAKRRSRSGVLRSMKLTERKHIFIDIRRAVQSDATLASPPEQLSLTDSKFMQTVLEVGKEDIYDVV